MKKTGQAGFRTMLLALLALAPLLTLAAGADEEWRDAYKVGDQVELHINGSLWQRCVVTENNADSVMRGRCEEFVEAPPGTYTRAGGVYILYKGDVRPVGQPRSRTPGTRPERAPVATRPPQASQPRAEAPQDFTVGDRVEIEASGHWVPCMVSENQPPSIMRVLCEPYPALSRDGGVYTVDRDNPDAVRKATGRIGRIPPSPQAKPAPADSAGLKIGEYACYGSGGRIMAGLGFKVLPGSRYTDLEGGNAGSFSVSGTTVAFRGGHLGGQTGRNLRGHSFAVGAQAECEPY